MTSKPGRLGGVGGVVGVGAAACAACCAAPIVGFLTAAGVASVLGAVVFGVAGFAAVAVAGGLLWRRRRRRQHQRCAPAGQVSEVSLRSGPEPGSAMRRGSEMARPELQPGSKGEFGAMMG